MSILFGCRAVGGERGGRVGRAAGRKRVPKERQGPPGQHLSCG
jgi:hypothetical protein